MEIRLSTLMLTAVLFPSSSLMAAQGGERAVSTVLLPGDAVERNRDTLEPTPALSPAEVVRIQIDALRQADVPHENAGIEIAFRFASPANKSTTGPLDRFIQLVRNPVYRPMLDHRKAEYGAIEVRENRAVQLVILTAKNGERVGYFFALSKQKDGHYASCWMTDGVFRFDIRNQQDGSLPI